MIGGMDIFHDGNIEGGIYICNRNFDFEGMMPNVFIEEDYIAHENNLDEIMKYSDKFNALFRIQDECIGLLS